MDVVMPEELDILRPQFGVHAEEVLKRRLEHGKLMDVVDQDFQEHRLVKPLNRIHNLVEKIFNSNLEGEFKESFDEKDLSDPVKHEFGAVLVKLKEFETAQKALDDQLEKTKLALTRALIHAEMEKLSKIANDNWQYEQAIKKQIANQTPTNPVTNSPAK